MTRQNSVTYENRQTAHCDLIRAILNITLLRYVVTVNSLKYRLRNSILPSCRNMILSAYLLMFLFAGNLKKLKS